MSKTIIPVILSGGAGSRLWPVSTKQRPKPFLQMPDGETLLEKTLNRANDLAPTGPIVTITGEGYYAITRAEYERIGTVTADRLHFVLEPAARNTAPAVAMAMAVIGRLFGDDAVAIIMPSDHLIADFEAFKKAVEQAGELAQKGYLVTFGIVPTHAETGYGYIETGQALGAGHKVARFVEKPPQETAQQYVASGDYLWNSGMFCFSPRAFSDALRSVDDPLHQLTEMCLAKTAINQRPVHLDPTRFNALVATSVDYAVMEKAHNVAVVPANIGWNDVGSWDAIAGMAQTDEDGNSRIGDAVMLDSTNCHVLASTRQINLIGLRDLVVLDTQDNLLICHRNNTQQVKQLVDLLQQRGAGTHEKSG